MLQPRLGLIKRVSGKQLVNKGQFLAALVKILMPKAGLWPKTPSWKAALGLKGAVSRSHGVDAQRVSIFRGAWSSCGILPQGHGRQR